MMHVSSAIAHPLRHEVKTSAIHELFDLNRQIYNLRNILRANMLCRLSADRPTQAADTQKIACDVTVPMLLRLPLETSAAE